MTMTPEKDLPEGVFSEKVLGMLDAAGEPTDDEARAETIRVERQYVDGEVETTTIIRTPARP